MSAWQLAAAVVERCGVQEQEEEEEEEEDLFVFNDTIEGPRAPAVKPGRVTQSDRHWCRGSRRSLRQVFSGGGDCRLSKRC